MKDRSRVSTSSERVAICVIDYIICGQWSIWSGQGGASSSIDAGIQVNRWCYIPHLGGAVAARRSIHIKDLAFKYKTTENKLLVQSTLNPVLFVGIILIFFTQVQRVCGMLKKHNIWEVQTRKVDQLQDLQGKWKEKSRPAHYSKKNCNKLLLRRVSFPLIGMQSLAKE